MSFENGSSENGDAPQLRIVLAKLGFDGHDRGIKIVARILRDAGMEVIYLGLRQSYKNVVNAVEQEDATRLAFRCTTRAI